MATAIDELIPGEHLASERMPGHWLLARLGKKVLRPGGRELTNKLLASLDIGAGDDVVELAPGLGSTTELVLGRNPRSYTGVDREAVAAERVAMIMPGPNRKVLQASAANTGLPDASADVVFGEAYLTMQSPPQKQRIVAELARLARPGARFGLHEIAFAPEDIDAERCAKVAADLAGSIHVQVAPLTLGAWRELLEGAGFEVREAFTAPLHLLEPRRLVADEGLFGALRFASRVARQPEARRRVMAMRQAMRSNAANLQACAIVATRREW
jgi:SAM-dependent methyltransferase